MDTIPVEFIWFFVSLLGLLWWLRRTDSGRAAFAGAPQWDYQMEPTDVLGSIFFYLATGLAGLAMAGSMDVSNRWQEQDLFGLILIVGWLITSVFILWVGARRFRGGLGGFGVLRWPRHFWRLLILGSVIVFGLTFLAMLVTLQVCELFGYEQVQKHDFLQLLEERPPFVSMVLLVLSPALAAPLVEELLFRGILQNSILSYLANRFGERRSRPNPDDSTLEAQEQEPVPTEQVRKEISNAHRWLGIALASMIFTLMHGNWQHWPALFVLAMGLGYFYERYGSLILTMAMHSLFNIFSLTTTLIHIQTAAGN